MEKLCKMFNVSDDTIVRAMKREGIPMRITVGFCDKENSNWKGGYSLHYAKNVATRHFKKNECAVCGYKISTDVHHWDKNKKNNNPDNLVLLCPNHHREVHLRLLIKENISKKIYK
jgi:predicted class III extradiol MEMO1 family dioxygenase